MIKARREIYALCQLSYTQRYLGDGTRTRNFVREREVTRLCASRRSVVTYVTIASRAGTRYSVSFEGLLSAWSAISIRVRPRARALLGSNFKTR